MSVPSFTKPPLLIIAALAAIAIVAATALVAAARLSAAEASSSAQPPGSLATLPRATHAGQQTVFGRIVSFGRRPGHFVMRLDPALWLTGYTAQRAKGSTDVPNDYFILDETHTTLSYVVPRNANVTVLTNGTHTTTISVSRLALRVDRGWTRGQGFWLLVGSKYPSSALSIDQQYQP